ncbi:MAG: NYN domain-containing protein [Anaerolineales bacterium]|jgi:hypothetical protein
MPYIIDGHNLIGALPNIDLADPDDERQLIQLLETFIQASGKRLVVHFDRGTVGQPDPMGSGRLEIHFAGAPRNADQTIDAYLRRLGGEAKNWTVVSSDRAVQVAARASGAKVMSSRQFARHLSTVPTERLTDEKPEPQLDAEEIEKWERLFGGQDETDESL